MWKNINSSLYGVPPNNVINPSHLPKNNVYNVDCILIFYCLIFLNNFTKQEFKNFCMAAVCYN